MRANWQTVRFGLRLMLIGAQTVGWSLAAAFALSCGGSALLSACGVQSSVTWFVLGVLLLATAAASVVGRLLCAAGRWVCTAAPPDATKARARIRLAVIFEACSLLSGAATVGLIASGVRPAPEFGMLGAGFWLLTTVLGRICFFAFGWTVAEHVRAHTTTEDARILFRLSLFTFGAAVLGTVFLVLANQIQGIEPAVRVFSAVLCAVGTCALVVAAGLALYLFFAHFLLITDLRRHLDGYQPKPAEDDPDREYLERHLAAGGSADDA